MGLDAEIAFKAKEGVVDLDISLPLGYTVDLAPPWVIEDHPGATHEVDCGCSRYYGIGYERGHWPALASALMTLFAEPDIEVIWYGHDCGVTTQLSKDDFLELCQHWMEHGNTPYRQARNR